MGSRRITPRFRCPYCRRRTIAYVVDSRSIQGTGGLREVRRRYRCQRCNRRYTTYEAVVLPAPVSVTVPEALHEAISRFEGLILRGDLAPEDAATTARLLVRWKAALTTSLPRVS